MLKQLRQRKTAKKILWGLAIIIIPAFILWGSASMMRQNKDTDSAGRIFGRKISLAQYEDSLIAVKNQAVLQYGEKLSSIEKYLNLTQQAWERLILLYEAKRRKIKVADPEIISAIQSTPLFEKDGRFNQGVYDNIVLGYLRTPKRVFEETVRDSLKISKLYQQITDGITIDDQGLEEEYRKKNEEIMVKYLAFEPESHINEIAIGEEELAAYFDANKNNFMRPIIVNIQYAGFDYAEGAQEEEKTKAKNQLLEIRKKINNAGDFQKISQSEHMSLRETGFFAPNQPVPQIGWSEEFNKIAFNLGPKEISAPVDTARGIYILALAEKKEAYIPEFSEIKEEIKNILKQEKMRFIAEKKAEEFIAKTNEKNSNIDKLAKEMNLKSKETPLFKRDSYIEDIGISEEFSEAAFNLKAQEISRIIKTPKAFYIILAVIQRVEINKEKFEKEKDDFRDKLITDKKMEEFFKFLQNLKIKSNLTSYVN
ncbi:MAG: hypothetical protein COV72_01180 [Candidatus Omnitrophica bacterium CG11_big_fil_rev_8_21_14_0_20_42_13]|uniref:Periplasmic chaperone PpiD n=1 Tax=Candidatus Ghiorseimicrobium undicola TaxID=1974746 RepID=A0A2H0M1K5_9BACT|nr:MAG: hypothetical protein COV72_01180 [Candidatus Omnitrophica bacterium CG11_big_fil_rev_8_21_14_0_20_42_13]